MYSHELPSGATIQVTPLPYLEAWSVSEAVLQVVERLNIDIKSESLEDLFKKDILSLKGPICAVLSSPVILHEAQKCFKKCLIDDKRIDGNSFEPRELRGDFIPAAYYALLENVSPFFESLFSLLKTNSQAKAEAPQKSK